MTRPPGDRSQVHALRAALDALDEAHQALRDARRRTDEALTLDEIERPVRIHI